MQFHEYCEIFCLEKEPSSYSICLRFSIQKISLDDFKHSFLTDKYITTIEWYRIYRRIKRCVDNFKNKFESDIDEGDEFNIHNLKMKYKFLPTEGCTFNLLISKAKYYMDITITQQTTEKTDVQQDSCGLLHEVDDKYIPKEIVTNHSKPLYSPSKANAKASEDQYHPEPSNDSKINTKTYIPSKNSPISIKDEYLPTSTESHHDKENEKYTPSKIVERELVEKDCETMSRRTHKKIVESKLPSKRHHSSHPETLLNLKTQNLFGEDELIEESLILSNESEELEKVKRRKINPFVKCGEKVQCSSPSVSNWLSKLNSNKLKDNFKIPKKDGESTTSSTKTKAESKGKKSKPETKSRARDVNVIPEDSMNKVQAFLEKSKQKEEEQKKRKKELRNLKMLHCKALTNEEMKNFLNSKDVRDKLEAYNPLKKYKPSSEFNYVEITTSNIFTENQVLYILKEVENIKEFNDENYKTDVLLPELMIYIFGQTHHFDTKEAIQRIQAQEERRDLYDNSFS